MGTCDLAPDHTQSAWVLMSWAGCLTANTMTNYSHMITLTQILFFLTNNTRSSGKLVWYYCTYSSHKFQDTGLLYIQSCLQSLLLKQSPAFTWQNCEIINVHFNSKGTCIKDSTALRGLTYSVPCLAAIDRSDWTFYIFYKLFVPALWEGKRGLWNLSQEFPAVQRTTNFKKSNTTPGSAFTKDLKQMLNLSENFKFSK